MTDTLTSAPADGTREDQGASSPPDERQRYIDGLRVLAAVLERDNGIPLPWAGRISPIIISFLGIEDADSAREALAGAARAFPCTWAKNVSDGKLRSYFDLDGRIGGLMVQLTADRDAVCKRVVTGIRQVTEMVKDPERLAEVPEIEVTRTVEDVTWECGSLLAPRPDGTAAIEADGNEAEVAA